MPSGGNVSGLVMVNDNARNNPQQVAVSGMGQDFSLAAAPGSASSATVTAGRTATYTLSVAQVGGMKQPIALSCSGAPSSGTCSVSPNSIAPSGSSPSEVTVTV